MMIAFLRKNLTCLILKPISSNVCKSPAYLSRSLKYFSTSSGSEPDINHKLRNILVHKHNFDAEFVSRLTSKLTRVKNPEKAGLVLSFFKESGFSDFQLEKIVICKPRFLSISLEDKIKPNINFFQEMGLSSVDISKMMLGNPRILQLSLNHDIIPSLSLLKCLLVSNDEVTRVIRLVPRIMSANLEKTMLPNVEFLRSCGVPIKRIRIVLSSMPNVFLLKPEIMRKSAEKANEMGLDASSERFIYAVPTIASLSNEAWVLKLQAFRNLGFSDNDILTMFRNTPQVFVVSMEKIKKIKELLLDSGNYTMSSIVEHPKSLQFSIEKRYMPRLHILGILESRNVIKKWPSLSQLCSLSDSDFFKKFIIPYSDKEDET